MNVEKTRWTPRPCKDAMQGKCSNIAGTSGAMGKKYKQSSCLGACTRVVISKCACLLHVGHANVNIVVCLLCVAVYVGDDEFVYEEPHVQYSCDSPQVRTEAQHILLTGCLTELCVKQDRESA